jgi:nucleotide-binding universal stress UspA family protein
MTANEPQFDEASVGKPIIVGVDGSSAALRATEWAATEAAMRGSALRIVFVTPRSPDGPHDPTNFEAGYGREVLATAHRAAVARAGTVPIDTEVLEGRLNRALIGLSDSAELLVVSSTGIGYLAELMLGSTAEALARRSRCPVAVVRISPRHAAGRRGPVVAVVDPAAATAPAVIDAAYAEAQLHETEVILARVIRSHPWHRSPPVDAASAVDQLIADRTETFASVPARSLAVGGTSTAIAHEISTIASLVVVERDQTELSGVAHAMLHHADCPVLIVPTGVNR